MFVASIIKIKTINKDVLDSEWTLRSFALRLVFTCQQIRMCRMWKCDGYPLFQGYPSLQTSEFYIGFSAVSGQAVPKSVWEWTQPMNSHANSHSVNTRARRMGH